MNNGPIGVFDSGIGGLTCIDQLTKLLPKESIIYFGDTARAPYGEKSVDTIRAYSLQIADFLISQGCKMLVIACNTISSTSVPALEKAHPDVPIQPIIAPAAEMTVKACGHGSKVGVIATPATAKSGSYAKAIALLSPGLRVYTHGCPYFVSMAEKGITHGEAAEVLIKEELDEFVKGKGLSTLVLGCTHYPFLADSIEKCYPGIRLLNPSTALAETAAKTLAESGLAAGSRHKPEYTFCASSLTGGFRDITSRLSLGRPFKLKEVAMKDIGV